MKIGLVRRGYSGAGGAESYLGRFADALRVGGHQPVLFCGPDWRDVPWSHGEKRVLPGSAPGAFARALMNAATSDCHTIFSLERVLKCDCYRAGDGVHKAWLERRARSSSWWKTQFRRINPKHREILALENALFAGGGAGKVIANSRMVCDEIRHYFGYPADRLHVIYNGLPPSAELPAEVRQDGRDRLGARPGDCVLLFAGSGWERKGLAHAIAAVNALPAASRVLLVVAGRGNSRAFSPSPRVRFVGPAKDVPALLEAADIFILPTLYDPFSNACLEALAAGLPVITTAHNGFSEIIRAGEHGEIVGDPGDITALTAAISNWLDPVRTATARASIRAAAAPYTAEANMRQTLEVLLPSR